jgi:hypothetical protein
LTLSIAALFAPYHDAAALPYEEYRLCTTGSAAVAKPHHFVVSDTEQDRMSRPVAVARHGLSSSSP